MISVEICPTISSEAEVRVREDLCKSHDRGRMAYVTLDKLAAGSVKVAKSLVYNVIDNRGETAVQRFRKPDPGRLCMIVYKLAELRDNLKARSAVT